MRNLQRSTFGELERMTLTGHTFRDWMTWGFATYVGLHLLLYRPVALFRASHRLFSILAVWLFGGQVASVEEAPPKYLAQILGELRNGGLVESRRGKQGGYLLAKPPEEISLHDVIGLVEGSFFSSVSRSAGASGDAVADAWNRLQRHFEQSAKAVTLPTDSIQTSMPSVSVNWLTFSPC